MSNFTSSTTPGCRLPHFWSKSGKSLYDSLGQGYTLVRRDNSVATEQLSRASDAAGVPMTVVDVAADDVPPEYTHALTLTRPDQVVAWRGHELPRTPAALVDRVVGRGPLLIDVLE